MAFQVGSPSASPRQEEEEEEAPETERLDPTTPTSAFTRKWLHEDEIILLEAAAEIRNSSGMIPCGKQLCDAVRDRISLKDPTRTQVGEKMRMLKRKFERGNLDEALKEPGRALWGQQSNSMGQRQARDGHAHPMLYEALKKQSNLVSIYLTNQLGYLNEELADKFTEDFRGLAAEEANLELRIMKLRLKRLKLTKGLVSVLSRS